MCTRFGGTIQLLLLEWLATGSVSRLLGLRKTTFLKPVAKLPLPSLLALCFHDPHLYVPICDSSLAQGEVSHFLSLLPLPSRAHSGKDSSKLIAACASLCSRRCQLKPSRGVWDQCRLASESLLPQLSWASLFPKQRW